MAFGAALKRRHSVRFCRFGSEGMHRIFSLQIPPLASGRYKIHLFPARLGANGFRLFAPFLWSVVDALLFYNVVDVVDEAFII